MTALVFFALGVVAGAVLMMVIRPNVCRSVDSISKAQPSVMLDAVLSPAEPIARTLELSVNRQKFTFRFKPHETSSDLASEFCSKMGPGLGFTEVTIGNCVMALEKGLDAELAKQNQSGGQSEVPAAAVVEPEAASVPGVRQIKMTINEVVYVFEYHEDMTPEYAAPRLASEFCFSDKGMATVGPLSKDIEDLSSEVERDALVKREVDTRCTKPLTIALLEETSKLL